ncbi:MAG TPA: AMIN domain-containing protein [Firmicutes bacterium]|jgi:N-acetylmuramoyl-L-alanine amidase|nr:AMIN domain-containing protein [Bacillota bacterium]
MRLRVGLLGVFSLLCFLLLFPGVAGADHVSLEINRAQVESDVSPLLVDGRTLVPVRVVSENLGARVSWDGEGHVTILDNENEIVLTVGSREVLLNGESISLDVSARIISGRTLVPLRFVSEIFGAQVAWDGASRTVRVESYSLVDMHWEEREGKSVLVLDVTGQVGCADELVPGNGDDPTRLVLHLQPARLDIPFDILPTSFGTVRTFMESKSPNRACVAVELPDTVQYNVVRGHQQIRVEFKHQVTDITYQGGKGKVELIKIHTSGPVSCQSFTLSNPDRIVIDIENVFAGAKMPTKIDIGSSRLVSVRASQFSVDPATVRVVLDMEQAVGYQVSQTDDGLLVYFAAQVEEVKVEDWRGVPRIRFDTTLPVTASVDCLEDPLRLVMRIPGASSLVKNDSMRIRSGPVSRVEVAEIAGERDGFQGVEVTAYLRNFVGYRMVPFEQEGALLVELVESPVAGLLIAIDAGHGGEDPGAISVSGHYEKYITIDIAEQLRDLLEHSGAEVFMIREGDRTVDLLDRPALANAAGADLYVSVHANSFNSSSKAGTETYYFPEKSEGKRLATAIHRSLVSELGLPDRGVRYANFAVLRETTMPAALAEVAFLSNPQEERLLLDPGFRRRVAEALWKGIIAYCEGK